MPSAGWFKYSRDPALVERDLQRHRDRHPETFPQWQPAPFISRAEARFAAEVALAALTARDVPSYAHARATLILETLANG